MDFDVVSIHGAAFTSNGLASASGGTLNLCPVSADGVEHKWFMSRSGFAEVNLESYNGILFLDPLFISGGFMRHRLWGKKKGISPRFLEGAKSLFSDDEIDQAIRGATIISSSQWFEIFKAWRVGTFEVLDSIRLISKSIPILLVPPVNPPPRQNPGLYAYYYRQEQDYLGRKLFEIFGSEYFLQPEFTLNPNLTTVDVYHAPAPDPHHPSEKYYEDIVRGIDFETLRWSNGLLRHDG
ncbi:hypothetical protein [Nioella nitratireducens]|uniref:hypothetical protein n=1 Tax=Nioella nitratireducens TaxID=1287720 RepID=UPI0011BAB6F7|nr:hypothetical protein [Nioella nitratireducens]